jgi:hypothetical protein
MATRDSLAAGQAFAKSIIETETYKLNLIARANAGILAPQVESLLLHYAYGKPIERIESRATVFNYREQPLEALVIEAEAVATSLKEKTALREQLVQEQLLAPSDATETSTQDTVHFADFGKPAKAIH